MTLLIGVLVAGLLKPLMVAGVAVYAGLVLMSYRSDGARSPLRLELSDPVCSAERLVVWLGVGALALTLRVVKGIFDMLAEASAEVGEWFLRRRGPAVQAAVRSRFMI